ncbi:hypothetical protein CASFOL_010719 [Castilleja foliolosa]|uniref:DUF1664 domain-containing protein n=1 Tax=Castilleja foliolosa TaxID=1961234 RepID=A0ABD3DUI3_9LAMI
MASQSGIGLSKFIFIFGAELQVVSGFCIWQKLVRGVEKSFESGGYSNHSDAIATQVRRLATEVRQLASGRQITVLNGNSDQSDLTSLLVAAAALGALGGYTLWKKGISFSDLMYGTKHNMANAVSNLTKHLDHVCEALAATKWHLTRRIENLDGKLDEQVEVSKLIRNEVNDVRDDLSQIGFDLGELQRMVSGLELANARVMYLCGIVNGEKVKMPEKLQDQLKPAGKSRPTLTGLKGIADSLLLTDGNV